MKKRCLKNLIAAVVASAATAMLTGCGPLFFGYQTTRAEDYDAPAYQFPLSETQEISGLISYPSATEPDPNKRTIFRRLEEKTNVHVNWQAIPSDQWGDKIALQMVNYSTLPDFVFTAGFSDSDLLRYGDNGIILPLENYIDRYMPNLTKIFEDYPEYKTMCLDEDGHIWALPWIEQLGAEKTAIQTVGDMGFINKKWLDFLGLEVPRTVDEFEATLRQFQAHAAEIQREFNIDGSIIPMSCIINDGDQDPAALINGFGEGYGDGDRGRHIAVTDDGEVICSTTQPGFRTGIEWLHKLYAEDLIDKECFTQEWSTYVSKGKSGRYGVCFSWDVANIDNLIDWTPLPPLEADVLNYTPQNGSYTSGFDRGRCVVTAICENPALVLCWLDQMYDPFQSPQNNWGTYGDESGFNIFELSTNVDGQPMLKHTDLQGASPVEVREAQCVGGPLAVLNEYYDVYVTCPDDAQYRLDWIEEYFTPYMTRKNVYPNMLMNRDDTEELSNLSADITAEINRRRSDWIMNGLSDRDWTDYVARLDAYGLDRYLAIFQKYFDRYNALQTQANFSES